MFPYPTRPVIMGRRGVVTSGHYLATAAGFRIMEAGGNAIDAAAAMCFCLVMLEPQNCGLGGEVPTLVYSAKEGKAFAISGMGWSPQAFNIDWCRRNGVDLIPGDGYLPACVPSVVDTWAVALAHFGTQSLGQVLQPAIELAEEGFPLYEGLHACITANAQRFAERYPSSYAVYCPQGRIPEVGDRLRNPGLAYTYRAICRAEAGAQARGRAAGLEAGREAFYSGEIAERIVAFISTHPVLDATGRQHAGLLSYDDLAGWRAQVEEPVTVNYRGLDVHKCSSWTQGPVFLQQLTLLEGFDLRRMGHNSAEYLHTWVECAKLAFADREAYYGDPQFDRVPFDVLLSKEYAAGRRELVGQAASLEMRPGAVGGVAPEWAARPVLEDNRRSLSATPVSGHVGDTTHLDAVDSAGNMVAATPSGGWIPSSPVIEGLGFPLGTRGQMFYLNPARPNALAPHKRPRATLTPSLVTRQGEPFMVFGTPGGDAQDQWTLQFFLNYVDFGMDLQAALDAPTVHSLHFPSSFYPRDGHLGLVEAERSLPAETIDGLARRGHTLRVVDDGSFGKTMGIRFDRERGLILGACAPKGKIGYAFGW
jgi:gamma-glutamyltranspeptidase/glutathione hydrolase